LRIVRCESNVTRQCGGVMLMAHDVFVSYSSQDKLIGNAVCASLEAKKIRCWIAPRDVLAGVPYGEALADALAASRVLVLVLSARANESQHIMREVENAVDKGIPIVPFRIENVLPSKALDYFLKAIHWLDALTPPLEAHLDKLAETVRSLLARGTVGETASKGAELSTRPPHGPRPSQRWRLAAIAAGLVLAIGAVLMIQRLPSLRPGEKDHKKLELQIPPAPAAGQTPTGSFQINVFRPSGKGDDIVELGELGHPGVNVLQADRFELQAHCSSPFYAHVVAINPDGSVQVLFADSKDSRPRDKLRAPLRGNTFYTLDDAGTQAVLLVVAEQPLPEFDVWRPKLDREAWQKLNLGLPWKWDGQSVVPMDKKRVGVATYGPEALATACRQVQALPTVVAVHAAAFSVEPRTSASEGAKK
jgi:hypothetical protein